ncbi:SHOCT domain-containing protein [Agrococcus sp. HG114]|uniref:SHOCT domain-containing protein n=1 Tax=Agrococcus sp. HG114 TaxID=2969757 RepID=UPI00215B4D30|nr:SHOCT domain-containing protein [Agrococcus sp. HG114]MCR8671429.1 SHOCT domain-containing protein [Agrococcus sp. HG114]
MMWDHGYAAWWMWIPGMLITLVIIAGIVVAVVLSLRGARPGAPGAQGFDAARSILEERLARGEIGPEQFRELLEALEAGRRRR